MLALPTDTVTVTRMYDAANRLTDVLDWSNHDTHFGYDANGNLTSETLPTTNPTTSTLTYDTADQLTRIVTARTAGSTPFRWTFGYGRDPLGQVSASTDRMEGMRHSYGYDALNRLTNDTRSNRTKTSWSYDAADNLKTQVESGSGLTKTLSYDTTNSELTSLQTTGSSTGSLTFGYNANGDRISQSGGANPISYGYNQADQLTSYGSGATNAQYTYSGDGLRTSKTVNGTSEGYVWNLAEGMPTILQDGSTRYLTGPGGLPIEQVDGSGTIEYYIQDQLGSTRGLLDSSGNVVGTYTFTPYGEVKGHSGASTPFGYAGQYTDSESGLQYLQARYYDPSTAQFLTLDPLLPQTGEPYAYTTDNPVNAVDPSGLAEIDGHDVGGPPEGSVGCGSTADTVSYEVPGERNPRPTEGRQFGNRAQSIPRRLYLSTKGAGNALGPLRYLQENKWQSPPGWVGPKPYENRGGSLNKGRSGDYWEYDTQRKLEHGDRGQLRLVVDFRTGEAWYTNNHATRGKGSWIQIRSRPK